MAMGLHGGARGGGRRRAAPPMSEINVTPLVDVMLVLLIIFMVAAPLLVAGVPLDLPAAKAKAVEAQDEPVTLSIDAAGRVFLGEEPVAEGGLAARLAPLAASRPEARVLVRADRSLAYGQVLAVLGEAQAAGFRRVSLLSSPPPEAR
jgi:biopolymer transport protein TolR